MVCMAGVNGVREGGDGICNERKLIRAAYRSLPSYLFTRPRAMGKACAFELFAERLLPGGANRTEVKLIDP